MSPELLNPNITRQTHTSSHLYLFSRPRAQQVYSLICYLLKFGFWFTEVLILSNELVYEFFLKYLFYHWKAFEVKGSFTVWTNNFMTQNSPYITIPCYPDSAHSSSSWVLQTQVLGPWKPDPDHTDPIATSQERYVLLCTKGGLPLSAVMTLSDSFL